VSFTTKAAIFEGLNPSFLHLDVFDIDETINHQTIHLDTTESKLITD